MNLRSRLGYIAIFIIVLLAANAVLQVFASFQEPEAQTVAIGYFTCAGTSLLCWLGRGSLQRFMRLGQPGVGWRFLLMGSLGAAWVETAFWAAEKLTGAVGVAANPNLLIDLLVTMPWYIAMVGVFWLVYRRYQYSWMAVALLGGLYELGADGILGGLLGGNAINAQYLLQLCFYYFTFVVVYSPMLLPAVWGASRSETVAPAPVGWKALAALAPLLPLVPYGLVVIGLFG